MRAIFALCVVTIMSGCGGAITVEEPVTPATEEKRSYCDYDVNGACVKVEDRFMDIDPIELSWMLGRLEYEVDFFYPGLDFDSLAETEVLKIDYRWANINTEYSGLYYHTTATARVNLRRGENITPLMECVDRYYVAAHEVLHFIVDRYLVFNTYEFDDAHNIPYIFRRWSTIEDLPYDYTVEGRLYTMIARRCYDGEQE